MTPEELRRKAAEIRKKAEEQFKAAEKLEDKEQYEAEFRAVDELLKEADGLTKQADDIEAEERRKNEEAERLRKKLAEQNRQSPARDESRGRHDHDNPGSDRIDPGEQEDDRTRSLSDWLFQVAKATDKVVGPEADERLRKVYGSEYRNWREAPAGSERRALSISSGTDGGYLMPSSYRAQLMEVASEGSIVRPRATAVPMDALEVEMPALDQTTAPTAGQTSFFGGVHAEWTADEDDKPQHDPGFRSLKLRAYELAGYTEIPKSLLDRSAISMDILIRRLFGGAIGWYEDYAFLRGNGVGKPLGVLNGPSLLLTGTARGSSTAVTMANMVQCWTKQYMQGRRNAVWVISHGAESAFLQMTGVSNTVVIPVGFYVQTGDGSAAGQPLNYAVFGRPVLVSEKLPALNTAGDIGLYDFSQYLIGDTGQLEVAVSEHYKFRNRKIAYRFVHHVGGMPWLNAPITLSDAETQVSPFVQLQINS